MQAYSACIRSSLPFSLFLLLLFFVADNFTAFVVPAVWADGVRQAHLAAVTARDQVACNQRVVGATAVTATGSMFPFWLWGHCLTPVRLIKQMITAWLVVLF